MEIIRLRAFADNYIWGLRHQGHLAVVDPGDAAPVSAYLKQSGDRLSAILLTHHHNDHVGGVATLTSALCEGGDITVFGPAAENISGVTHPLHGDEEIEVPGIGLSLHIIAVPGHTRGHIAYYHPDQLFCGDTLFPLGCGRLFEGTPDQMWHSLSTLAALPGDTQVYCAHEYTHMNLPFALEVEPGNPQLKARAETLKAHIDAHHPTVPMTLADEIATNVFLRPDSPEVIEAAKAHSGNPHLQSPVGVFAALREWRNTYVAQRP
ncbi:MAG TPA: hydroxyacylglutathione hydrolase [Rhodocyclaceae bacterium]|nr:hydroxyacylglutathione hydrolase [Rhodocyclaceae bacterium]